MNHDLQQARIKHIAFKSRLRAVLYGSDLDDGSLQSEYECSLGKWIYEEGLPHYGHIAQMDHLEKVHKQMHVLARRLIKLYREGQQEQSREGLVEVEKLGKIITELLEQIDQSV